MKYTSIKSVLHGLSTLVDEENWNENYFLEWAVRGARKLNLIHTYMDKVCEVTVSQHSGTLPADCQYITMAVVYNSISSQENNEAIVANMLNLIDTNAAYPWMTETTLTERVLGYMNSSQFVPLKRSTSPFMPSNNCTEVLPDCGCTYEYIENPDGTIYTSFVSGIVVLAYKGFAANAEECLIPDNEDVKEAIEAFVLSKYFEGRSMSGDRVMLDLKREYQEKFSRLATKAKSLNLPDIESMEAIGNMRNRLKPQSHQYDKLFSTLGNKESINFSGHGTNY